MYVYTYTKCSPLAINDTVKPSNIVTWCTSGGNNSSYLFSEHITPSMSLYDFIGLTNMTPNVVVSVLLQLINALNVAYKLYDFTHYDLHTGNVLIREFSKPLVVPYFGTADSPPTQQDCFQARFVPYIIDYGYSHVKIQTTGTPIDLSRWV